jgi:hypothetical protein
MGTLRARGFAGPFSFGPTTRFSHVICSHGPYHPLNLHAVHPKIRRAAIKSPDQAFAPQAVLCSA